MMNERSEAGVDQMMAKGFIFTTVIVSNVFIFAMGELFSKLENATWTKNWSLVSSFMIWIFASMISKLALRRFEIREVLVCGMFLKRNFCSWKEISSNSRISECIENYTSKQVRMTITRHGKSAKQCSVSSNLGTPKNKQKSLNWAFISSSGVSETIFGRWFWSWKVIHGCVEWLVFKCCLLGHEISLTAHDFHWVVVAVKTSAFWLSWVPMFIPLWRTEPVNE